MNKVPALLVEYLVVHHSASDLEVCCNDIRQWHLERGWDDIGYHWLVNHQGEITPGRAEEIPGAHAYGLNSKSLGICCIGHFERESPSERMINALIEQLTSLCFKYELNAERIIGHCDVVKLSPEATKTQCPGESLYALLQVIRKEVQSRLSKAQAKIS